MIPKRIFYAWFGGKTIPNKSKLYIKNWQKLNPDFEIIQIDESNFDVNSYDFTKEAYRNQSWAFVSDVARLQAIYKYGGFYFDTDVELIKGIINLTNYKSVWALEQSNAINSGLIIGAQKNDSNLRNLLSIYRNKDYIDGSFDNITIGIISNYFENKGFKRKNKFQLLDDGTVILPVEYFAPIHYWGGGRITKKTIGIHHYDASWTHTVEYGKKFKIGQYLLLHFPFIYHLLKVES